MCVSVCVCVCVSLSIQAITFEGIDIETSFLVWWYVLTISRPLGQGQGHFMENANFCTWTSVKLAFDLSDVKSIPRSVGQGHLMENVNFATWTSV